MSDCNCKDFEKPGLNCVAEDCIYYRIAMRNPKVKETIDDAKKAAASVKNAEAKATIAFAANMVLEAIAEGDLE